MRYTDKNCEDCGDIFTPASPKAKYCLGCRAPSVRVYKDFRRRMSNPHFRMSKLLALAKNRAKYKNLAFDLDIGFLEALWTENQACCALTGHLFDLKSWGKKGQVNPNAPSIDRIVPSDGYIKTNIRLITYHMNVALSDFGEEEFERLSKSFLGTV